MRSDGRRRRTRPSGARDLAGLPEPRRGKVRDVYDLGDRLLIVATDRLSAYDHVLRPPIPGKGQILTQLTNFWFDRARGPGRRTTCSRPSSADFPAELAPHAELLAGRAVLARKAEVDPVRVRGARLSRRQRLPRVPRERARSAASRCRPASSAPAALPEPIFTPATKAESGPRRERRLRDRGRRGRRRASRPGCAT